MILFGTNTGYFEEEDDEEEGEGGVDDALLDELDAEDVDDDLLEGEVPPVVVPPVEPVGTEDIEHVDTTTLPEEDDEDMDYDSFDDKDDL